MADGAKKPRGATGLRRGPLKVVSPLRPVSDATAGTAASAVSPVAPEKPSAVGKSSELSKLWDEVVPQLDRAGLLSSADVGSVELALRHLLAARQAHEELMENGPVVTVREADLDAGREELVKRNPAELVFRLESAAYMEYAKQLGMTFVARARTTVTKGDDGDANPFSSASGG